MTEHGEVSGRPRGYAVPLGFALCTLALHLAVNAAGGYGFFRDEYYYLACAGHPDLGYVDQPPLSIYLLAASRALLGDSLFAVRLLPAVAGALTVFVTGLLAGELGGRSFARATACLATFVSPIAAGFAGYYSMNAYDLLFWALAAYLVARLVTTGRAEIWLAIGLVVGLGSLNKISALWLGAGIAAGMLLTAERRWLRTPAPWIAGGIALATFLPYVLWNLTHDFAHLEFIRNASGEKYASQNAITFLSGQLLMNNPVTVPVWGAGLAWYLTSEGKRFRILVWIYLVTFAILLANGHSKPEYLAPAYCVLFAAGGVMLERWLSPRSALARPALLAVVAAGALFLPLSLPMLPVATYVRYAEAIGAAPGTSEGLALGKLPQHYADCFGWEEMTTAVSAVYRSLPEKDRAGCVIYCQNYGEAGALEFLGRSQGLPRVISGHNNYWLWGPGEREPEVVIIVGGDPEDHRRVFARVEEAARVRSEYAIPYENNLPVYVCRGPKVPLREVWLSVRHYM